MKLRKSLVAAATALTVATAGTTVAMAQDSDTVAVDANVTVDTTADDTTVDNTNNEQQTQDGSSETLGSSIQDAQPEDIKAWISVFTALITALGTVFAFAQKYL